MQEKCCVQAFYVKNRKILLDDLPAELYDRVYEQIPKFYDSVDDRAWVSHIEKDDIKYHVVISRNQESVEDFMNAVLFTEEILNGQSGNSGTSVIN